MVSAISTGSTSTRSFVRTAQAARSAHQSPQCVQQVSQCVGCPMSLSRMLAANAAATSRGEMMPVRRPAPMACPLHARRSGVVSTPLGGQTSVIALLRGCGVALRLVRAIGSLSGSAPCSVLHPIEFQRASSPSHSVRGSTVSCRPVGSSRLPAAGPPRSLACLSVVRFIVTVCMGPV